MSHLSKYESTVLLNTDKYLLEDALEELGITLNSNIKTIRNAYITTKVDAAFIKNGKLLPLGIQYEKTNKGINTIIVGDYFGTGINEFTFTDKVCQLYKKHEIIFKCKMQGWTINKEDITIDSKTDEIVINASRYAV